MAGVPPTVAEFKEWLRVDPADMIDDSAIAEGLAAAAVAQESTLVVDPAVGWDEPLRLACLLRCARWLARRNSPEGLVGFGDFGPARVATVDRDVAALEAPYQPVVAV